jgi:16S rRNA (cytosine967-C5)-methyltransferase
VLADVPCTGTGTLARHPDARWKLTPDAPVRMAELQGAILEGAAGIVRPGGRLVYSTCTLEEEENEGVVRRFLEAHQEFETDGADATLRVLPGETSTDGAFAVRMRRAG